MRYLIIFLLTLPNIGFSQKTSWAKSFQIDEVKGKLFPKMRGFDVITIEDESITKYFHSKPTIGHQYSVDNAEIFVQKYNRKTFEIIDEYYFETKTELSEGEHFLDVVSVNNEAYMLVGSKEEGTSGLMLHIRPFVYANSTIKEPIYVGKVDYTMLSGDMDVKIWHDWSKDEKTEGFYTIHKSDKSKSQVHEIQMYFAESDEWKTMSVESDGILSTSIHDIDFSDDGNFVAFGYGYVYYKSDLTNEKGLVPWIVTGGRDKEMEFQVIKFPENSLRVVSLEPLNDGSFVFVGHMAEKATLATNPGSSDIIKNPYSGLFFQKLEGQTILNTKTLTHNGEFIYELWNQKYKAKAEKKEKYPAHYESVSYPNIMACEDGSIIVSYKVKQDKSLDDPTGKQEHMAYVYWHLVVNKFTPEGELEWNRNIYIHRSQSQSGNHDYGSRYYQSFQYKNRFFFMFNEKVGGSKSEEIKTKMVEIDLQGNISEFWSRTTNEKDEIIRPEYCFTIDPEQGNEIFLYATSKIATSLDKQKLGVLLIED
jgi:hypothetical protein